MLVSAPEALVRVFEVQNRPSEEHRELPLIGAAARSFKTYGFLCAAWCLKLNPLLSCIHHSLFFRAYTYTYRQSKTGRK